jgi:hypothetical protein
MADDDDIVARGSSKGATVTHALLDVADNGTFRNGPQREDIADGQISLLPTVDELAGVHALGGDEELFLVLEAERMAEGDLTERGPAAGVVDDVGDDALDVAVPLGVVERSETRRALAAMGVGGEDGACSFPLASDDASHGNWLGPTVARKGGRDDAIEPELGSVQRLGFLQRASTKDIRR